MAADALTSLACSHCGETCSSRNALFRHLKEKCDPAAARSRKQTERIVLVIGYIGSRFHGCVQNHSRDESIWPTVEGAVVSAVKRAWGDVVTAVARSTKTDKGFHASENVLVLTVRSTYRDPDALDRELAGSNIWLTAPANPVPSSIFDKVYDGKKRTFKYYVPYFALLGPGGAAEQHASGLWISNFSDDCQVDDMLQLLTSHGIDVQAADLNFMSSGGHAEVEAPAELVKTACQRLHGLDWHGKPLFVMPLSEARAKISLQKRIRKALKSLRGPATGHRDFHNFILDAKAAEPTSMRKLAHCAGAGVGHEVRSVEGESNGCWAESEWTFVTFSAKDFGPQQLRRMMGTIVAVARGSEDVEYIDRCFSRERVPTLPAPSDSVCLDSVIFGQWDSDWRGAAGADKAAAQAGQRRIEQHILQEAGKSWREFAAKLDAGETRAHLKQDLWDAAALGDVQLLETALHAGAPVDGVNEYGQSASFFAAHSGHTDVLHALAARNADLNLPSHGGTTPIVAAAAKGHRSVVDALKQLGVCSDRPGSEGRTLVQYLGEPVPAPPSGAAAVRTVVIAEDAQHAGAGTITVDGVFDDEFLNRLDRLFTSIPVAPKEKASPTERNYFADTEGWVLRHLNVAVEAGLPGKSMGGLPQMRFLHYPDPGGSLPPHIDLHRTYAGSMRSTHTFLLYLSDCTEGGETAFLECLEGDVELAKNGGMASGERSTIAVTKPQRGRLLLMPHSCPHAAFPIVHAPKVLVRGEVGPLPGAA